jgi:prolyl-tRNA synthetase
MLPIEKVATPGAKTIEELAAFLSVPKSRTAKAVFLIATLQPEQGAEQKSASPVSREVFVFAIVRGDMEVNETKLANAIRATALRPAAEADIRLIGAEPGYASPIGLPAGGWLTVVDDLVPRSPNLVAGANQAGYHLKNVNYGRDYTAQVVADIAAAQDGDACPNCASPLRAVRGVEVGNIFKLGTDFSDPLGCTFTDQDGQERPVIMGSYGIGSGRLLACVAEEHHDEYGLRWPVTVAPYQVHLIVLGGKAGREEESAEASKAESLRQAAEALYERLQFEGIEVLYDDREESPGVKFNDADLIGLPVRLTVSERALKQGGIEFKRRDQAEKSIIPLDTGADPVDFSPLIERIRAEIIAL